MLVSIVMYYTVRLSACMCMNAFLEGIKKNLAISLENHELIDLGFRNKIENKTS